MPIQPIKTSTVYISNQPTTILTHCSCYLQIYSNKIRKLLDNFGKNEA